MTTWSTNFLYHCTKDLNEPVSPKGLRTIQSARFFLINGFSFPINSQLYQYIDKYGGAFGLARAEPTHLCDVKAARPCMMVLNAPFLKTIPHTDYDIKMRIQIEQIGQFMVGTPEYTAMGRSMQILRHIGSMICSGIRKPGKYTCRLYLIELEYIHSGQQQNESQRFPSQKNRSILILFFSWEGGHWRTQILQIQMLTMNFTWCSLSKITICVTLY